ncbi:MAG: DUF6458 family protein [Microthrixaceae bacterium]
MERRSAISGFIFALVLIAAGAILKYAVTATVSGVKLETVGMILMIVGAVAAVVTLIPILIGGKTTTEAVSEPGHTVVERRHQ